MEVWDEIDASSPYPESLLRVDCSRFPISNKETETAKKGEARVKEEWKREGTARRVAAGIDGRGTETGDWRLGREVVRVGIL